MKQWLESGSPWIWLTSGAVSVSLISVLGVLLLIGWKGLTYFWPAPLYQWHDSEQKMLVGQLYQVDSIPVERLLQARPELSEQLQGHTNLDRLNIKVANRDQLGMDFISVLGIELSQPQTPQGWAVIQRAHNGDFFGKPIALLVDGKRITGNLVTELESALTEVDLLRERRESLVEDHIQRISREQSRINREIKRLKLNQGQASEPLIEQKTRLASNMKSAEAELKIIDDLLATNALLVTDMRDQEITIPLSEVFDVWFPNDMNIAQKVAHWFGQVWMFVSDDPRESNSEGGVFPAIFGTVFLVLLMSVVVTPLGVIAAIYLSEYAKDTAVTRMIRIAVINLAGVPSIVYGVFGLGFFVYTLGGSIDALFYSDSLPSPTFGTPGLLWSSLTLALLTLPVVIVSTEEGLQRIPSSLRHGSLALGATQFETWWRIVLPMASPAIITGLILAVARAAGEVAPLMLVGVVKLAPALPVDGEFPFIHLDRKFMHLGFHIYDVGFQSPNIEAARPLVYATSFLLVTVIVGLNLTAFTIRNRLREKYRTFGQE
ncbi:phosphate ABC transporter permease PstA [Vibrio sp. SCSIO 43136]|uniref:phosphate ABC transporter permease PstA n=1 Tax=Vibrio sp. SCSIO 43136 TaxID=2819101 RepID=UPI002074AE0B|nr:phosphate ABC transporter permease PstA [Vibrio sp. SCSIO 43136]USD66615.1 phosphate ABC transporter permease PstA [Vibrio sp. SCSIO 43136]